MKKILILLFIIFSFPCLAEVKYVSGFEDLPMMDGMVENVEDNIVFDTLNGRLIQSFVKAENLDKDEISKFYKDTLSSLDWVEISTNHYEREGEKLNIEFISDNPLSVMFELK